jgi:hypothetical protein
VTTSWNGSAIAFLAMYMLLLFQPDFAFADERLTLYDRNKRNLQSQSNSGSSNYSNSQRQYYGGRDYYYNDYQGGRERTVGRPTTPWE